MSNSKFASKFGTQAGASRLNFGAVQRFRQLAIKLQKKWAPRKMVKPHSKIREKRQLEQEHFSWTLISSSNVNSDCKWQPKIFLDLIKRWRSLWTFDKSSFRGLVGFSQCQLSRTWSCKKIVRLFLSRSAPNYSSLLRRKKWSYAPKIWRTRFRLQEQVERESSAGSVRFEKLGSTRVSYPSSLSASKTSAYCLRCGNMLSSAAIEENFTERYWLLQDAVEWRLFPLL